jgi:hypothetical protein
LIDLMARTTLLFHTASLGIGGLIITIAAALEAAVCLAFMKAETFY